MSRLNKVSPSRWSHLLEPFHFQGYELYTDNFYSSPGLFQALLDVEIRATRTLCTNRVGVPSSVVDVKCLLEKADRGTGYYIRTSSIVERTFSNDKRYQILPAFTIVIFAFVNSGVFIRQHSTTLFNGTNEAWQ